MRWSLFIKSIISLNRVLGILTGNILECCSFPITICIEGAGFPIICKLFGGIKEVVFCVVWKKKSYYFFMWNQNASLRIKNVYKHEVITAGLSAEKCKFWSIRAAAEFLEVKLACNLGVPSEGIPEAGSKIVKLVCLKFIKIICQFHEFF